MSGGGDRGGGGGGGGSKPSKAAKDPNAPKKPKPAYKFWCATVRTSEPYASMPFGEQNKALGAEWKALSAADKAPHEAQAAASKSEYERELAAYEAAGGGAVSGIGSGAVSGAGSSSLGKAIKKKGSKGADKGAAAQKGAKGKRAAAAIATPTKSKALAKGKRASTSATAKAAGKKRRRSSEDDEEEEDKDEDEEEEPADAVSIEASEDDAEDEEQEPAPTTPSARAASRALIAGGRIPRPQNLPVLEGDEHFEPRMRQPMRLEKWSVGVEVAWVPQGLAMTLEAHAALIEQMRADDEDTSLRLSALPTPDSALVRSPADGTANAAIVTSVQRLDGGVTLLTLRSTDTLGPIQDAGEEGGGGGADGADGEGEESSESGARARARFVLPVLDRLHCDVDQYCLELSEYKAALERVRSSKHVAVPFAEEADVSALSRPKEVLWEGRIFDDANEYDQAYPTSKYRCLHVAWYRQLKRGPDNPLGDAWVFDDEQTDNLQSPWCTQPSNFHGTWRTHNPKLAQLANLRPRRGVIKPNALTAAPESLDIDPDAEDERDLISSVLKRLLSNEASSFFYHPVPPEETAYHEEIKASTCLLYATQRLQREEYSTFAEFATEIELMISNCFKFNGEDTAAWILGCIMQADWRSACEEMRAKGHGACLPQ